jgi:hypothetical protein
MADGRQAKENNYVYSTCTESTSFTPHVHIQFWCIKNDADADMETNEFLYVFFFLLKTLLMESLDLGYGFACCYNK